MFELAGGSEPAAVAAAVVAGGQTAIVLGVGDIGMCGRAEVAQVARLVATLEGSLLLAGDIAYFQGTAANFRDCFNPSWGRFRDRVVSRSPATTNTSRRVPAPYFDYFGDAAGPAGRGYYSTMIGDWLVLMLNSNIPARPAHRNGNSRVRSCRHSARRARMAVWHHPLLHAPVRADRTSFMRDMWALLEASRAEVVLNGHDHLYERFARQMPDGRPDPVNGIRQFTAGTGGAELYNFVAGRGELRGAHHAIRRRAVDAATGPGRMGIPHASTDRSPTVASIPVG